MIRIKKKNEEKGEKFNPQRAQCPNKAQQTSRKLWLFEGSGTSLTNGGDGGVKRYKFRK